MGHLVAIKYPGDIFDKVEVDRIKKICEESKEFKIKDIKETETQKKPLSPFTTSTLQQAANSFLGFSPSRTMRAAQKLYEAGFITYMRTDSPTLSKQALGQISNFISNEFGRNYLENRIFKSKSKNAQEAHEAIRPTNILQAVAGNNDDQKNLYRLI